MTQAIPLPRTAPLTTDASGLLPPRLPRLRADLVLTEYSRSSDGRVTWVASSGGNAYLLAADAARVLRAIRSSTASGAPLDRVLREDGTGAPAPAGLDRFLTEGIPAGLLEDGPVRAPVLPFLLRFPFVPPRVSSVVARPAAWLFSANAGWLLLAPVALLCAFGIAQAFDPALRGAPRSPAMVLGLLLLSMFVHELGHVSACARAGVEPGEIGFAIYFWFPVFYADVSRSWTLPRLRRMLVTAGGFWFQAIAMAAATLLSLLTDSHAARWFVFVNALSIVHMCNPVFKMDGYWLLSDAAGIPNLHRRVGATLRAGVAALLRPLRGGERAAHGVLPLRGWQVLVLAAYIVAAVAYIVVIGERLWTVSLGMASHPGLLVRDFAVLAQRAVHSPTPLMALSRVVEMLYLVLRPLLVLAAWVFLGVQLARLAGVQRAPRAAAIGKSPAPSLVA